MTPRGGRPLVAVGAFVMLAAAIALQIARDRVHPLERRQTEAVLYVQSGAVLRRLALEFDALAADTYWIRALQRYGGERLAVGRPRNYGLLQPLLDLTTDLDPYFTIAYRFGAIFLSESYPGGPGRPDQAIALLQKGIRVQPEKWQFYHDIGFVHYWHLHDPRAASDWFLRGSRVPKAPNWLEPLAASILSERDRAGARFLWQQILKSDEPWLRRTAERSLMQLQAMDDLEQLQAVVRRYPPSAGVPFTWLDYVERRVLVAIPADPTGAPYVLDPRSGAVTVSPQSVLNPLPNLRRPER